MAVFVLILFDLLLRQRGKIILFKTGNKKCAAGISPLFHDRKKVMMNKL